MTIFCQHLEGLGYPRPNQARSYFADGLLVTFRPGDGTTQSRSDFTACDRLIDIPVDRDIGLDHLEEDTPLAHLAMWDIAHVLPVGKSVFVLTESDECFFDRAYFRDGLQRTREDGRLKFKKIAPLRAEMDRGLDRWSFGIPVGPEDATLLNVVVKRILDLEVGDREIILCGKPGANFAYHDHVRIVGEDITAPPLRIAMKKNRIVQEARYENLCILHDRVFLPIDFIDAIKRFGDFYALQTMQSIYFDDLWCMVPRRYSDAGLFLRNRRTLPVAMNRGPSDATDLLALAPSLLAASVQYGYAARNALRYRAGYCYPTGSMYVCKRQVWQFCPQDDRLHWTEFEDVEHGLRASDLGIPNMANPHAVTQSLIGRPALSFKGSVLCEQSSGRLRLMRAPFQWMPAPRKPLFKVTVDEANKQFGIFAEKYKVPSGRPFSKHRSGMRDYLRHFLFSVESASFHLTADGASGLFRDVCKYLSFEQDWADLRHRFVNEVYRRGRTALRDLTERSGWLQNIVWQRPFGRVFVTSLADYLPKQSLMTEIGIRLTARSLSRRNGDWLFLSGDYRRICAMLRNSTPWRDG
jgi:hypothetical protein